MAKFRLIAAIGALTVLTSCAAYDAHEQLDTLNQAVPSGSKFTQRLAVEYRDLANYDDTELLNYANAEHFSRKGLKAAVGQVVPPENPVEWSIDDSAAGKMLPERQKLVDLLDNGGREIAPDVAAVAQARFDCWVERAEKSGAVKDQSVCHMQFEQAMEQLAAAIAKANTPPAPPPPPAAPVVDELREATFIVFFDFNKAAITTAGSQVIDTAAGESQRLGAHHIIVIGNSDLVGTDRYNQKLSLKRAQVVKTALIRHGIPAAEISVQANGDTQPIVPTAKGIKEPANRRAEIRFE